MFKIVEEWVKIALPALIAMVSGALGLVAGMYFRLKEADLRRWQADRRAAYANFLQLAQAMARDLDGLGCQLRYDPSHPERPAKADDEAEIKDQFYEYVYRWETELQPALMDVQLLSGAKVADAAQRVVAGLLEATTPIELQGYFTEFYPMQLAVVGLIDHLQDSMRSELGVREKIERRKPGFDEWPWLEAKPPESYRQGHGILDSITDEIQQQSTATPADKYDQDLR